jgi:hypothetical protein
MSSTIHAPGWCSVCHRDLMKHGNPNGGRFCDPCGAMLRRNPGIDPAAQRNGRSEQVPQERPVRNRSWRASAIASAEARCAGAPWELFEVDSIGNSTVPPQMRQVAHVYCGPCPVRAQCAAEADEHQYEGLFGGVLRRLGAKEYVRHDLLREEVA